MKKKFISAMAVSLCLCMGAMLTACGEGHEHSYQTEWSKDEAQHWHACEGKDCTEVADKAEHTWNDGEITTPATADADGEKTFTCTVCGQTKTVGYVMTTKVEKEDWTTLISTLYNGNFYLFMSSGPYEGSMTVVDDLVKKTDNGDGTSHTEYYANEDGRAFLYKYENDTWYKQPYMTDVCWANGILERIHRATWAETYSWKIENALELLPIELLEYDLFRYDEESNAYYCESIEVDYGYSSDFLKNIYISFVDGKLFNIKYDYCDDTEGDPEYAVEYSCAEEDIVVSLPEAATVKTLPTDYSQVEGTVTTIETEFDWQQSIISFQQSNGIYFEGIVSEKEDHEIKATIFDEKIKIVEILPGGEGSSTTYYAKEIGKSYIYEQEGDDTWIKRVMKEDTDDVSWEELHDDMITNFVGFYAHYIMPELYDSYGLFEYDEELKVYYLEYLESYIEVKNIRISFENGKLISLTFEYASDDNTTEVALSSAKAKDFTLPVAELDNDF